MLSKCCIQYANKSGKQHWPQDWKVRFHSNPKERQCQECSNYCTIALISHASKVMLKILQGRLQKYMNRELPDVEAGFRKGRGTRDQIANICWILEKSKRVPEKHLLLLHWLHQSLCVDHNKLWKILKEAGIPDHLTCLLRNLCAGQIVTVKLGHGTTDWFKSGKEYVKAVYCHSAYLTCMQSTSCEMLGWMKHKLESRLLGEVWITSDTQVTPPLLQKVKKN